MSVQNVTGQSRSTEESPARNLSAGHVSVNDHPLAAFRNIPAVVDDRIHAFVCRATMSGKTTLRPSLLCTQVSQSLGGSDTQLTMSRILAHCGEGRLLTVLAMTKCPACGATNEVDISPGAEPSHAVACAQCDKPFSFEGAHAVEALTINRDFCAYLRTMAGLPA